jgi:hypothetical protein
MTKAVLEISSKNYSSWCLRGFLLCKLARLDFEEKVVSLDDPSARAELLLLSPSFLVPSLTHAGVRIWDGPAHFGLAHLVAAQEPEGKQLAHRQCAQHRPEQARTRGLGAGFEQVGQQRWEHGDFLWMIRS